ncbi:hypothetical protein J6590_063209 [Homalodisca vitripennis]|nr:hypothetical protein J6590_063209 [Homalodisca vitripennis]
MKEWVGPSFIDPDRIALNLFSTIGNLMNALRVPQRKSVLTKTTPSLSAVSTTLKESFPALSRTLLYLTDLLEACHLSLSEVKPDFVGLKTKEAGLGKEKIMADQIEGLGFVKRD